MAEPVGGDKVITDDQDETAVSVPPQSTTTTQHSEAAPAPAPTPAATESTPSKRNAFTELMSSKPPKQARLDMMTTTTAANTDLGRPVTTTTTTTTTPVIAKSKPNFYARHHHHGAQDARSGLLSYILHPETYPSNIVLRTTAHTVLIKDLYPKATIHLLLLPRSEAHRNLHPHDAFQDAAFLAMMQDEARTAAHLASTELSRLIGSHSHSNRARNLALDAVDPVPDQLPPGRDYVADMRVGVHAHPSMSHLHVHIISRDMHSASLKHRKHYNSFQTEFFIPLADYPLAVDDGRRRTAFQNDNLKRDFVCWRCARGFGNRFKMLKDHLDEEFVAWRNE